MSIKCPHCGSIVVVPDDATDPRGACAHCGGTIELATAERVGLEPGRELGGCRVERLVGRGGMAMVYEATQLSLERPVALKILSPGLAQSEHFVERFEREAAALSQLSHPNLVHIISRGREGDTYYLVMEYVDGESLRSRLRREGPLPLGDAVAIADQVAAGLAAAHAAGVLHRDIKPENILLASTGTAKLSDFGIARLVGADEPDRQQSTSSHRRMGSAPYMAPEQTGGSGSEDHRADLYALGVTLYEMLTGQLPAGQLQPASALADGVPKAIDRVLARALAADPDERYQDVPSLRAALEQAAAAPAPVRRRVRVVRRPVRPRASAAPVVAFVMLVLLIGAALLIWRPGAGGSRDRAAPGAPEGAPGLADGADRAAEALLRQAARHATDGQWQEVKARLDRLDARFAHTSFYAMNRAAITRLRTRSDQALRPPPSEPKPPTSTQPSTPSTLVFTGRRLTLEAEKPHVRVEPMEVARDSTASGGQFVWEPRGRRQEPFSERHARVVYYVRCDRERWVHLWARVRAPDNSCNSLLLAIEPGKRTDGALREWHFGPRRQWAWSPFSANSRRDRENRRPTPLRLRPGVNSIIIAVRERATALDQIRITAR